MKLSLRSLSIWSASGLLITACASGDRRVAPTPPAQEPTRSVGIQASQAGIAQRFVQCVDCAKPTPKTLVAAPAAVTASAVATAVNVAAPAQASTPPEEAERYSIRFPFNSAALSPAAQVELRRVARQLDGASSIRITGFTDSLGAQSPNTRLAEARAVVVMQALRDLVPDLAAEIRARGQALCCYLLTNDTEAGRETNRRAEIAVTRDARHPTVPQAARLSVAARTTRALGAETDTTAQ